MMVVLYHFLGKNKLCDKNSEIILINILKEINDTISTIWYYNYIKLMKQT